MKTELRFSLTFSYVRLVHPQVLRMEHLSLPSYCDLLVPFIMMLRIAYIL